MRIGLLHRSRKYLFTLIALGAIGVLGHAFRVWIGSYPTFAEVKAQHRPSDVWLVDREGVPLQSVRSSKTHRSLEWVKFDEISAAFVKQLVATEDRRFFHHIGVDVLGIVGALRDFARGFGLRGASTITMQLVKNLDRQNSNSRGVWRWAGKLRQIVRAIVFEMRWSKREILEAYVNRVTYRGEVEGLRAASLGFFAKSPAALDNVESAVLVVLLRSPNSSFEVLKSRLCLLFKVDSPDRERALLLAQSIYQEPIKLARERDTVPVISKYFIESDADGSILKTSLNSSIQRFAMRAVREQLMELEKSNVRDAAVLVLETKTGRPLAYVANGGPKNSSAYQVDGIQSRRQLGSTIKAFVYGTAYDLGVISTTTLLSDSPENVAVGSGQVYQPRNYDHTFRGPVGAAEAFGSSLNVPAVRVLSLVSERRVIEKLRRLGFTNLKDDDQYGPSLALGTVDATLWELAQGYRQLSLFSDSKVFSENAKRQIFESISIAENRRFTFGVESLLQLPFPVAVKTGTSKDMRDNWCVGYTSEYTVAAWVGNFNGDPMWNVSGITGAAPLWRKLMLEIHRGRLPQDPVFNYQRPEPPLAKRSLTKIRYPVRDMLIGIDPDIPENLQKVPFRIEGLEKDLSFQLNGRRLGRADQQPYWKPVKGNHVLRLVDPKGRAVDEVSFVVR